MAHFNSIRGAWLVFLLAAGTACSIADLAQPSEGRGGNAGSAGSGSGTGTGGSVSSEPTYLSDLTPSGSDNGWGPHENDTSNGEQAAGDGQPLSVAGVSHDKGLGTHATSQLAYHLSGKYARFTSSVGVDDEVLDASSCGTGSGSVVFSIEVDGEHVFESEKLVAGAAPSPVDLELEGAETLVLSVSDGGDGNECDHADWLNAAVFEGKTNDSTAPVISEIVAVAGGGEVTITFSTDDTSMGFVQVNGVRTEAKVWTRRHSVQLSNLDPSAPVSFSVGAENRDGFESTSETQELQPVENGAPPIPTGAKLVTEFGAIPDDGVEDTQAILAAAAAAGDGGAVGFPSGVYDLGASNPVLPGKRQYVASGAELHGKSAEGHMFSLKSDDILFAGFELHGGGIFIDHPGGGFNQGIEISWNRFYIDTSGSHRSGITATSGLQNSKIANNYFTGQNMSFGIYGYNYDGLTIANNEFVDVGAGMHIDAFGSSGNLLVEQNYIKGAKGMGMEFQSSATNLVFQDNWYEHPNLSTDPSKNGNSMAFSLILDKSKDIVIRRNTVIAPERPDGKGCRIGFEIGGDNSLVEDNYINGVNHVAAMNDGVGSASVVFKNNKMMDFLEAPSCSFCNSERTFTMENNGENVNLTWDINRGPPAIGKRY